MATLTIPDDLYKRLQDAAARQQRPVLDILGDAIALVTQSDTTPGSTPMTREEETRLIREAMKGRIWTEEDVESFFSNLDLPEMSDEEAERIIAAIPPLDPPLSHTVIQMREEERY